MESYRAFQLELEGMHLEEGTDSGADSAFLMRLMEINEDVDEAQTPEEAEEIGRDTRGETTAGLLLFVTFHEGIKKQHQHIIKS